MKQNKKVKIQPRKDRNNNPIKGDFITTITSTAIYNKFSRSFGGKLRWFRYKPENIANLSNTISKTEKDKSNYECLNLIDDNINENQRLGLFTK